MGEPLFIKREQIDMPILKAGSLVVVEGCHLPADDPSGFRVGSALFVVHLGVDDYGRSWAPRLTFVREIVEDKPW